VNRRSLGAETSHFRVGGAILYVIGEIWHGMRRFGHHELGLVLLSAGFAAGILTDLVVAYGGG
jgi:hypothetical protein